MSASAQPVNKGGYPLTWVLDAPGVQPTNASNNSAVTSGAGSAIVSLAADVGQGQGDGENNGPSGPKTARPYCVPQLSWSYAALPTAGTLVTLQDGANIIYQEYIAAGNLAQLRTFNPPLKGTAGNSLTATAVTGGQSCTVALPNVYVLAE